MYLLYVDESGQHGGDHFVLGGIAVFERQTYWIGEELDRIQSDFFAGFPGIDGPIALHASDIRGSRSEPWVFLDQPGASRRHELLDRVYEVIVQANCVLFGVIIERRWLAERDEDEYLFAFESLVTRFDHFLKRKFLETGERQRGLIIIAESEWRKRIEGLALRIGKEGTRWGELRNLAEIPLFTLARNSRLLQAADFVANAVWGRYERGYTRQFDKLVERFDYSDGTYHGLAHYTVNHAKCPCPACFSRRLRNS